VGVWVKVTVGVFVGDGVRVAVGGTVGVKVIEGVGVIQPETTAGFVSDALK